jgi:hypothetical protein
MLLSLLPVFSGPARAAEFTDGTFTVNDAGEITVYAGLGGAVTIPGTVDGVTVKSINIASKPFVGKTEITKVVFPAQFESIPSGTSESTGAFSNCTNLTEIEFMNTDTTIGNNAFANCTSLESVDLPENLMAIGGNAFFACHALESIKWPVNLESLGTAAFLNCTSLKSIVLPNSVKTLGGSVFAHCTGLEEVILPAGLTSAGTGVFMGCALESIDLPNGLETLDDNFFPKLH